MLISGAEIVIKALKKEGVDTVFGYPGGMALPLYDALYDSGITHILTRHEQGAVHAADGYARSSGKVGVCIATSGPGATNLVTGIATANMDSVPIVCITCQVVTGVLGKDSFQEADVSGITTPITKHNFMVKDKDILCQTLAEAFYIARTGRPGPVVIDIPKDIFTQEIWFDYPEQINLKGYRPRFSGNERDIQIIADALSLASRPLFFFGGGTVIAGVEDEIKELLAKTGAPFVNSIMGLSLLPKEHPQNLGMLGMHGTFAANMAVSNCDLLIAMGVRFSDRVTGTISKFAPGAKIAHFDIDPSEMNKNVKPRYRVLGDLKWSVPLFLDAVNESSYPDWLKQVKIWQTGHPLHYDHNSALIKPQAVVEAVNEIAGDKAIVVTDVGQHQMWTAQYGSFKGPRTFLTSGGLGTMGYGLPAAIGAALACPDREIWLFVGDGGMMMNCQELPTAQELGLNIKIVIMNNQGLGMVRQWQRLFYNQRYSGSKHLKLVDYVRLAEAFDVKGLNVNTMAELKDALAQAHETREPIVLNVRVEDDENVLPMVPPNGALDQMID